MPPRATQKLGNFPLSDCIADTTIMPNCNTTIAGMRAQQRELRSAPAQLERLALRAGRLCKRQALGCARYRDHDRRRGASRASRTTWSIRRPPRSSCRDRPVRQHRHDLSDGRRLDNGRGVISFTLTGDSDFPSAAYAPLDARVGMGGVHVGAAGAGPWDGFTSYGVFGAGRPRWGDYGATAVMAAASGSARSTSPRPATTRRTAPTRPAVAHERRSGTGRRTSAS